MPSLYSMQCSLKQSPWSVMVLETRSADPWKTETLFTPYPSVLPSKDTVEQKVFSIYLLETRETLLPCHKKFHMQTSLEARLLFSLMTWISSKSRHFPVPHCQLLWWHPVWKLQTICIDKRGLCIKIQTFPSQQTRENSTGSVSHMHHVYEVTTHCKNRFTMSITCVVEVWWSSWW